MNFKVNDKPIIKNRNGFQLQQKVRTLNKQQDSTTIILHCYKIASTIHSQKKLIKNRELQNKKAIKDQMGGFQLHKNGNYKAYDRATIKNQFNFIKT